MSTSLPPLRFTGHKSLATRLVLSTLTGRPVHISQIRPSSPLNPGLAPHEISLLRLLEAVTNGTHIEISYTGTILVYKPGLIVGNTDGSGIIRHEIPENCTRGVSYFLIPLALLSPFSKAPVSVVLTGPGATTSSTPHGDISVDTFRTAILPLYAKFGIDRKIELRILQRSTVSSPGRQGHGEVQLLFGHQVRVPQTLHFTNCGRIKRIRGVAASTGVSGSNNARMIDAARAVLNQFVPDTYVFSDVSSAPVVLVPEKNNPAAKKKVGLGFGLSLVAESSTGALYSADATSPPEGGRAPEDVGKECAYRLLESITRGGCASLEAVSTIIILMAMGSEDVGRVQLGKDVLAEGSTVELARDLRNFGLAGWGIRDDDGEEDSENVIVSIVGRGIGNVARKIG